MRESQRTRMRWRGPLWTFCLSIAAATAFASCNDTSPSGNTASNPILRFIPACEIISTKAAPLFMVVQLEDFVESAALGKQVLLFVTSHGSPIASLPGPVFCGGPQSPQLEDGGVDGSAPIEPSDSTLTIPAVAQIVDEARHTREASFLLDVPAGTDPIYLYATAYAHGSAASACEATGAQPLAVGRVVLTRESTGSCDEAAASSSSSSSSSTTGTGAGGAMSSSESSSSGSTASGGGGT